MKEYIKLFNGLNDADGYKIKSIPFICTVKESNQNIAVDQSGKCLKADNDKIIVNESLPIIHYASEYSCTPPKDKQVTPGYVLQDSDLPYLGGTDTNTGGWSLISGDVLFKFTDNVDPEQSYEQMVSIGDGVSGLNIWGGNDGGRYRSEYIVLGDVTLDGYWWWECIAKDTQITLASGARKMIQDINYKDELLVWDFDNARFSKAKPSWIKKPGIATEYYLCKFSDGSELKLIGPSAHRLFNYTDQRFDYSVDCVGKEIFTENGLVTLLSCELVKENVEFYNIITEYHMNLFANDILTSCRYNNIYPINDMKFVKDNRCIVERSEFECIPDKYYYGMRLGEQSISIDDTIKYIKRLILNEVKW
jgi:hypothetical protein